mmetsp:Transcript_8413/g.26183  ORF Transcript_8413/g.26183 Transcript_8413/m.26183 type:complete len:206 (-) Transcript_8413:623-1240(-)
MVPGPALVTMQSAAAMYSSMFETKPTTETATRPGQSCASRSARATSFFPQTTTSEASRSPSSAAIDLATLAMPPTPSPPPTTRTVGLSCGRSSSRRTCSFGRDSRRQKGSRSGSPRSSSLSSGRPQRLAMPYTESDGTKHLSTARWNQVGWAEARSVTTVTKGISSRRPSLSRIFNGSVWHSGWTLTTASRPSSTRSRRHASNRR